jgi:chemotaxis protein histidine kinase CheA
MKEQDLIELELQQELREMFEVDTQNYLQKYLNLAQNLQSQTWQAQIQEMYRAIHTIKGGAVTVGADAILYVSTVLEDLLSDLRYLDSPPFLADGKLGEMLLEAGELLAGSISVNLPEDEVLAVVNPTIERIKVIQGDIKQTYLPEWSEQSLLHQEFAEQGFDLVVLDLEMALENLATESKIPANTIEVATITLQQLTQIGEDLQLGEGWTQLVTKAQTLLNTVDLDVWRSQWFTLLADLKYSAKHGGTINSTKATANSLESEQEFFFEDEGEFDEVMTPETMAEITEEINTLDAKDFAELDDLLAEDFDNLIPAQLETEEFDEFDDLDDLLPDELEAQPSVTITKELNDLEEDDFGDLDQLLPDELFSEDLKELIAQEDEAWEFEEAHRNEAPFGIAPTVLNPQENLTQESKDIKISIPLSRLDKTAQNLVDSLLAARASQGIYTQLKSQLNHLFILAQENAKYITRLRQIQDEYANLNELKPTTKNSADGVILEQYRQGYITINRLLETSLRLSELGAEVAEIANQTENSLDTLERNILSLQNSVQESRLLPFQTLAFRARAIIRDLNNRYQKSVQLHIEGEQIELDAGTSSQLEPALLHLLRNAFDHGIESSDIRTTQGKPPEGTIELSLQRQGKNLLLTMKDDGQGINAAKISEIAGSQNLPLTDTSDNNKLLNVICQPGFSSRTKISDISGRGVGMDVVAAQIESLGGKLKLETSPGVGTTFTMEIPPPTLLVPCLLVRSGDRTLAFPTDEITTTDIVGQLNLTNLEHSNYLYSSVVTSATGSTPVYDLLNYWNNSEIQRNLPETALAIYIQSKKLGQGVWFLADDLLGQRELLINSLPSPLKPPVGMMGLSLAQDGTLIPVLAPVNLAELILTSPVIPPLIRGRDTLTKGGEKGMEVKGIKDGGIPRRIVIVDDAALMRRRLEVSLSASGYNVQACVDGLDAWNWLQNNEVPDLLITDIEMPEMDGFTLIDRCRQAGLTIPILVISSRLSEEWNKEAQRVGANDYLTKGFSTPDLLNKVNHLLLYET